MYVRAKVHHDDGHSRSRQLSFGFQDIFTCIIYILLFFSVCAAVLYVSCLNITERMRERKGERGVSGHRAQGLPFWT